MRKEILNWWNQAKRDLGTAEYNLVGKRYEATIFFCHQAVEKALKALIMLKESKAEVASHSLIFLAKEAKLPEKFHSFLRELSPQYILTRYPDAAEEAPYELFDFERAAKMLKNSQEVIAWIRKQIE